MPKHKHLPKGGRKPVGDREVFEGIVWVLHRGVIIRTGNIRMAVECVDISVDGYLSVHLPGCKTSADLLFAGIESLLFIRVFSISLIS